VLRRNLRHGRGRAQQGECRESTSPPTVKTTHADQIELFNIVKMLAKLLLLGAVALAVASVLPFPSISSVELQALIDSEQTKTDLKALSGCVACEEAMGQMVHEAAESGWMSMMMFKICPELQDKYNVSPYICSLMAYLIMVDVGNHLQPDAVYNCEKLGICPKLPPGSAQFSSVAVDQKEDLVKVYANVSVTNATAAGTVEMRLMCPPTVGSGMDVIFNKYNAGLQVGMNSVYWEFTATSQLFGCDEPCPGTYAMKFSVCELECEDSKHAGHALLDQNNEKTFNIGSDALVIVQ